MTFDLLACGLFFNDLTFFGLPDSGPQPGTELRTGRHLQTPGGISNCALAAARLGLQVAMVCDTGDDSLSLGALQRLRAEGVDVSGIKPKHGWQSPLTVIMNFAGDRAMVTSETPHPGACALRAASHARARVAIANLQPYPMPWLADAVAHGTLVLGDVGWDSSGRWDLTDLPDLDRCHGFTPNVVEALHYTRTDTPAAALRALAEHVRLPVITLGGDGVLAMDAGTGEQVRLPALPVEVVDTGGAGDVFTAALAFGLLQDGWTLEQRLMLAQIVSALTVRAPGGASTAPTWAEIQDWITCHRSPDLERYRFLLEVRQH